MTSEPTTKKARTDPFKTWTHDEPCDGMSWNDLPSVTIQEPELDSKILIDKSNLVMVGVHGQDDQDGKASASLLGSVSEDVLDANVKKYLESIAGDSAKSFKKGSKVGGHTPTLRMSSGESLKRFTLIGLGKEEVDESNSPIGYKLGAAIASIMGSEEGATSSTLLLPSKLLTNSTFVANLTTGLYSALYSDNRFRTESRVKVTAEFMETLTLGCTDSEASDLSGAVDAIKKGTSIAKGIFLTKDIVNAPHNVMNSLGMANVARKIAEDYPDCMTCTILGTEECEKRGMGSYLGVARGSETPPQFVHLVYKGADPKLKLGCIGKGVMFDTGGYNIKTAMMELMKFDCGGAAAVMGTARTIAELKPSGIEVHFVVAACENMINQKAYVPSDILTASNGMTIEVDNTDAEGRLTMADALVFCDKEVQCDRIIELSTLTGACMVALGKLCCAVMTDDDGLAKELEVASKATDDKSWRLPLEKAYNEQLESKIADIKNCGTRFGGAITAGLFLQNFVDSAKPFAHIDIAGPVWSDSKGATGFGVKMVTEFIMNLTK